MRTLFALAAFVAAAVPALADETDGKLMQAAVRAQAAQMICDADLDRQKFGMTVILAAEESGRNISSAINAIAEKAVMMAAVAQAMGEQEAFCEDALTRIAPILAK